MQCGKCWGFFVKFFATLFPGNWKTKISEKCCQYFAAFVANLLQTFRKNFPLGDCGHNNIIFDGGRNREEQNCTLTKAASIPTRRQKAQGLLDWFFDAAPHLQYFSNFSSSALKRHLLKRHLTLSDTTVVKHYGGVSEAPCFPGEHWQEISSNSELLRW